MIGMRAYYCNKPVLGFERGDVIFIEPDSPVAPITSHNPREDRPAKNLPPEMIPLVVAAGERGDALELVGATPFPDLDPDKRRRLRLVS